MKKILSYFPAFVFLLFGCGSKNISQKEYETLLKQTFLLTPDSLLTTNQISTKIIVLDFFYTYITVENNKQKLPVTKKQLKSHGIPPVYFDVLQYQINENNTFIERELSNGLIPSEQLDVNSLIEESKERYWKTERPLLVLRLENESLY